MLLYQAPWSPTGISHIILELAAPPLASCVFHRWEQHHSAWPVWWYVSDCLGKHIHGGTAPWLQVSGWNLEHTVTQYTGAVCPELLLDNAWPRVARVPGSSWRMMELILLTDYPLLAWPKSNRTLGCYVSVYLMLHLRLFRSSVMP